MLYTTTRNNVVTYAAYRALREERAPDGGLYVPTEIPYYDWEALDGLLSKSAPDIVAEILNHYFPSKLSGLEVSFAMGRRFYGLAQLGHRFQVGELWRNIDGSFEGMCRRLTNMIQAEQGSSTPGMWMRIVCRTALVFALFSDLNQDRLDFAPMDVAVQTGNFEAPYALWLARRMGLNVGTILCCSGQETRFAWDLINRGQIRLNGTLPEVMELYFHTVLDWDGSRFGEMNQRTSSYFFATEERWALSDGFAVEVVSEDRIRRAIPNLYSSCGYILCPDSAMVYAALEDYRSRPGKGRDALMISERDPRTCADLVTEMLDIDAGTLRDWCLKG